MSHNGLITISSAYSVEDTINRVETDIKLKGLTVFARVDHAAGAMEVGLSLAPTQLLIFGNARGGTHVLPEPSCQVSILRGRLMPTCCLARMSGECEHQLHSPVAK